jgi:hypothetical protein
MALDGKNSKKIIKKKVTKRKKTSPRGKKVKKHER